MSKNNTKSEKHTTKSNSKFVSIDDVLESAEKFGDNGILKLNLSKYRDLKQRNKNSKFDCTYIPVLFKFANGKESPLKLQFSQIITASGAKLPSSSDGDSVKNLLIAFRILSREEIEGGDYVPKIMENQSEQEAENTRVDNNISLYLKETTKFVSVLEIIEKSYQKISEDLKAETNLGFNLRKDKKIKSNDDINVYSIKQTTREDPDTKEEIELPTPFYRIKLMLAKDGRVGIDFKNSKTDSWEFRPNVYDARKMTSKNNYEPVVAKVLENKKARPLTAKNAHEFITYKSMIGGVINFPEVVVSKFGISLKNLFDDLFVRRHKSNSKEPSLTKEQIRSMHGGNESEDDSDVEIDEDSDLEDHVSEEEEDTNMDDEELNSESE